jgi:hypothetical protein
MNDVRKKKLRILLGGNTVLSLTLSWPIAGLRLNWEKLLGKTSQFYTQELY